MIERAGDDGRQIVSWGDLAEPLAQGQKLPRLKQLVAVVTSGKFHLVHSAKQQPNGFSPYRRENGHAEMQFSTIFIGEIGADP
jgi:hypothetical protein